VNGGGGKNASTEEVEPGAFVSGFGGILSAVHVEAWILQREGRRLGMAALSEDAKKFNSRECKKGWPGTGF